MFCPKCKEEYRQGFYQCTDCAVDLVYEVSYENGSKDNKKYEFYDDGSDTLGYIEIMRVGVNEKAVLISILDTTDISYRFVDRRGKHGALQCAILMVEQSRANDVRELLKQFATNDGVNESNTEEI